jgi:hypothetical protein
VLVILISLACIGSPLLYYIGRPFPVNLQTEPFQGVKYYRRVHFTPYPMVAHIVVVDLQASGIGLFVTSADTTEALPFRAQTPSQFARSAGVQIAINCDGFSPWWARRPFDYYQHSGDRVASTAYGAMNAMNLDGGGSSTLVLRNALGIVEVVNSPIQTGIPGRERPVRNHLGVFAQC